MTKTTLWLMIVGWILFSINSTAQVTDSSTVTNNSPIDTTASVPPNGGLIALADQNNNDTSRLKSLVPPDSSKLVIKEKKITEKHLRLSADIGNIAYSFADETRKDYQIAVDYLFKKWYLTLETGVGKGNIDYDNLKYTTNSYFVRIGGDNSLLKPISKKDYDILFFGFRYGMAFGQRSDVFYKVSSPFGSSAEGTLPAKNFMAHWGEMTMGIKVEMWRGIYLGWNFRAKFLLNAKTFENTLTPNYIAGYGKGDNSTSFGFNVYLGYAIRWKS